MSSRRTPEELSDQLNDLEERFRRLLADLATAPTDVRLLYDARGDILVALDDNTPARLGLGAEGTVLTTRLAETLGVAWEAVNALRASLLTGAGVLIVGESDGVGAGLSPPTASGQVLTGDLASPLLMGWATPTPTPADDAEALAWLAMAMAS